MAEQYRLANGTAVPDLNKSVSVIASGEFVTPNALSDALTTAVSGALAMVPKDGLLAPVSVPLESGIDKTQTTDGLNYYVENLDVSAPGVAGQVWRASGEWFWKADSHIPVDGVSIVLQTGAETVSPTWLEQQIASSPSMLNGRAFPVSPTHYELADFADGFVFTAPADGWLFVSGEDHGGFQAFVFVAIWVKPVIDGTARSLSLAQCYAPGGYGADVRIAVPVRKGVVLTLNHNCTGAWYEFVY